MTECAPKRKWGSWGTEREIEREQKVRGHGKIQREQKNLQEILAVPADDSPGWPTQVLSISLSVHLPIILSEYSLPSGILHSFPVGQASSPIPRKLLLLLLPLSLSAYLPHRNIC